MQPGGQSPHLPTEVPTMKTRGPSEHGSGWGEDPEDPETRSAAVCEVVLEVRAVQDCALAALPLRLVQALQAGCAPLHEVTPERLEGHEQKRTPFRAGPGARANGSNFP